MEEVMNNLVFEHMGEQYCVPLEKPWDIYKGDPKPSNDYSDKVNRNKGACEDYFVLHITEDCNLTCKYCFQGDKHKNKIGPKEIENFVNYILNNKSEVINIRFFGGEPLLEAKLIKQIIQSLEDGLESRQLSTKIQYNVFTNGTILNDEIMKLIFDYNIVVFTSIDGCREMHNGNRLFKNGQGSFDAVIHNITKLNKMKSKNSDQVIVRTVFDTSQDKYSLVDIADEMLHNGFKIVSIEFPWTERESSFALDETKSEFVRSEIRNFAKTYINRLKNRDFSLIGVAPYSKIIGYLINKKDFLCSYSCSAGCEAVSIDVKGDIYPCHLFVGKDEFKLGNLEEGIYNVGLKDKFLNLSTETVESCKSCPIQFFCIGNCVGDGLLFNKDICQPNKFRCDIRKEIIKSSFYIYHYIKQNPAIERNIRMQLGKLSRLYSVL